jgi:hypothetical protein
LHSFQAANFTAVCKTNEEAIDFSFFSANFGAHFTAFDIA